MSWVGPELQALAALGQDGPEALLLLPHLTAAAVIGGEAMLLPLIAEDAEKAPESEGAEGDVGLGEEKGGISIKMAALKPSIALREGAAPVLFQIAPASLEGIFRPRIFREPVRLWPMLRTP